MKQNIFLCGILLLAFGMMGGCQKNAVEQAQSEQKRFEASFIDVFDTVTKVVIYDTDEAAAKLHVEKIHDELTDYHRLFDIYNSYEGINNIRSINENAGIAPVKVDSRLIGMIQYAKDMYLLTEGKMNIAMGSVLSIWHDYREAGIDDPEHAALPPMDQLQAASEHMDINNVIIDPEAGTVFLKDPDMRLDVGAIAKGYAGQKIVEDLRAAGVTSMLISLGGNVCGIGNRADGKDWKVSVQSPDMEGYLCYVSVNDKSLVTSGTYQRYYTVDGKRYHHIIDPETLMPAVYFDSVSVLCEDSGMADALSTALSILPLSEGQALISGLDDVEAMWMETNGTIHYSEGFQQQIMQDNN